MTIKCKVPGAVLDGNRILRDLSVPNNVDCKAKLWMPTRAPSPLNQRFSQTLRNISQYIAVDTFESMSLPLYLFAISRNSAIKAEKSISNAATFETTCALYVNTFCQNRHHAPKQKRLKSKGA